VAADEPVMVKLAEKLKKNNVAIDSFHLEIVLRIDPPMC
jgi:hypothetical protein